MGKVIIDGVNVSECDRLRTYRDWTYSSDKWCGISNDGGCECNQNPDCYYKQLQRAKAENERLKARLRPLEDSYFNGLSNIEIAELAKKSIRITAENRKLEDALQEIMDIAEEGLQSICYKANCVTCRCYSKKISNDTLENIINDYFNEDGDFTDTEGDFFEVLQAFIDRERVACNKAQPISEKILDKINEVIGAEE